MGKLVRPVTIERKEDHFTLVSSAKDKEYLFDIDCADQCSRQGWPVPVLSTETWCKALQEAAGDNGAEYAFGGQESLVEAASVEFAASVGYSAQDVQSDFEHYMALAP